MSDDAEAGGAIVVAPRDAGRRERSGDVALVRCGIWRIEREELADVGHPSTEEPAEGGRALDRAEIFVAVEERVLAVRVPQRHVDVAARPGVALVPLGHEGDGVTRRK